MSLLAFMVDERLTRVLFQGITKSAIRRLARHSGVKRISGSIPPIRERVRTLVYLHYPKHAVFDANGSGQIFFVDKWDCTPAEPACNLSYLSVVTFILH
jgi:hypothetical protein